MGYVEQQLMPNESVVFRTKLHPIIFAGGIILSGMLLIIAIVLFATPETRGVAAVLVLLAVLPILSPLLRRASSEFAVTNKRVIVKIGVIRRHTVELLLQKVETISVDQGVLGRMFDYGTITIRGTGGTPEVFPKIASPLGLRRAVNEQLSQGGGTVAG